MRYFVTAIGTDSGKTVVSAIITQMLGADYWKPVQSGHPRDTVTVQQLVSSEESLFYHEKYLLNTPASPHAAAAIDQVSIQLDQIVAPVSNRDLVIEGAGGVLVPLNDEDTILDLVIQLDCEVVLVSNLYLGSINHTLLTFQALQQAGAKIKGLIFNGEPNVESERIIEKKTGLPVLLRVLPEPDVDPDMVVKYAELLKSNWS